MNAAGWFDAPWRAYSSGRVPQIGHEAMAVGDMDTDGDADVVVGNSYFAAPGLPVWLGGVSVLKNRGDGNYDPPQWVRLPANDELHGLALADVDSDGDVDVLATAYSASPLRNNFVLFRNRSDGTLESPGQSFATGRGPKGIVVGDFTGDGFADVVTANEYVAHTVSLHRHNGLTGAAAGFLAPVAFPVGQYPQGLAAADLNGEGRLDLAVARTFWVGEQPSGLSVLLNNGAGGFDAPADYLTLPDDYRSSPDLALADVDNDGDTDLVSGGFLYRGPEELAAISVRRNAGNGTFGPAQVYEATSFRGGNPWRFATADLNRDGFPDVIAATHATEASDGYLVLLSNGFGGFRPLTFYEAAETTWAVAAADADRDGDADVLTLARASAVVTVHRNPGHGVFPIPDAHNIGWLVDGFDSADIDRDGDRDVVVNQWLPVPLEFAVVVMKNNGDGTFYSFQYIPPQDMRDLKLRDLNGDGFVDLLLAGENYSPYLMTALNNGDGTFAAATVWNAGACGAGTIDAHDLDNDGDRDVVLADDCIGTSHVRVFRNDGAGFFSPAAVLTHVGSSDGLAVADLNHDGNLDLMTAGIQCRPGCTSVGVYLGNGNLTFRPLGIVLERSTRTYGLADFNRDGHVDLALLVGELYVPTVFVGVALGNGDGTFRPAVLYPDATILGSLFSSDLDLGDANGDGFLDLVVTNPSNDDISLLPGNGDGTFAAPQHYGTGYYEPLFSAFADFSGDGIPDVASAIHLPPFGGFFLESALVVLRGLSDRQPVFHTHFPGRTAAGINLSHLIAVSPAAPVPLRRPLPSEHVRPATEPFPARPAPDARSRANSLAAAASEDRGLLGLPSRRDPSAWLDEDELELAWWQV